MNYRVGSVPYLNAKPLVKPFDWRGSASPVEVAYDVPSRLPALLEADQVQAVMVSSIEALRTPGAKVAAGLSIGTRREVLSVRLFSKVPPSQISSVAEDASSMTSNALARIVLTERYKVEPYWEPAAPSLEDMLAAHDACVMIGDNGMRADGEGLHVLDLGREWLALTGLPFVWALWVGGDALVPELVAHLQAARREGIDRLKQVIAEASAETGFTQAECRRYLAEIMDYGFDEEQQAGLREFGLRCERHGLIAKSHYPEIVEPAAVSAKS